MTYIIAEAGTTHYAIDPRARIQNAIFAIKYAAEAGADAIKWQLFVPDDPLFCPLEGDDKRWDRWRYTYLALDQWFTVRAACYDHDIDFLASVFQKEGINWLRELSPTYYKVASRAATTYPYDLLPGPFLISTGFYTFSEICQQMARYFPKQVHFDFLKCVSEYPTKLKDAWWDRDQGLSDHSGTVWPGLDAIARKAGFLEVHFCADHLDPGNDAPVCLDFKQLKLLCDFRDAKRLMG